MNQLPIWNERTVRARLRAGFTVAKHAQWAWRTVYDQDGKPAGRISDPVWRKIRAGVELVTPPVPRNAARCGIAQEEGPSL